MLMTVTVPPCWSRTWRAISRARRSSGLKIVGRAARFTVPSAFIASAVTLAVSGTCLMHTMLSYGTFNSQFLGGENPKK